MLVNAVTGKTCRVTLRVGAPAIASRMLRSHTSSTAPHTLILPQLSSDTLG
jgi:hypothetical protein